MTSLHMTHDQIEDLFAKLAVGKAFTKLDMSQAYQQLLLDEESRKYAVINTHHGLFRYNRLPFGISSAPGIFQRVMESILSGIPGVVVYIDDVLVTGKSEEEHLSALEEVLRRIMESGFRLRKDKCVFLAPSVVYLGHQIDSEGLHPVAEKVEAVQEAPAPKNVSELKSYLGLLTYYSRFLPNLSSELAPLYKLLKHNEPWHWTSRQKKAFERSKELLLSSQLLHVVCPRVTPRGVPGEGLSVLHVVCPRVTPRGVPGEGLSVLHVVCPRVTPRGVPGEGLSVLLVVCPRVTPRGVPGEGLYVLHVVCPRVTQRGVPGEGLSVLHVVCPRVTPRGVPGEGLSVLHVVCPLVTPRGVPGEGLSVLHVVCPRVTPRGVPGEGLSVLHVVCPLVTPRGVPGEGLSVLHVVCPRVTPRGVPGEGCPSCM